MLYAAAQTALARFPEDTERQRQETQLTRVGCSRQNHRLRFQDAFVRRFSRIMKLGDEGHATAAYQLAVNHSMYLEPCLI